VEGGRVNLCLVLREATFAALGRRRELLHTYLMETCPGLKHHLAQAERCTARPLAIAAIPYGLLLPRSSGAWHLGDQAAVIPSFTGEGMSIALHSARLASAYLLSGRRPGEFQRQLAEDLHGQVRRSTMISRALVLPAFQVLLGGILRPSLLRWTLRTTRIPARVRARA
jgi:flavin-dependent dehydrogenase